MPGFRRKALSWVQHFPFACYLNGHSYVLPYGPFPEVLAVGNKPVLEEEIFKTPERCFGFFGYDHSFSQQGKNKNEAIQTGFPKAAFFEAACQIQFFEKEIVIRASLPDDVWNEIQTTPAFLDESLISSPFKAETSKDEYLQKVEKIKELIREGWIYELNYCQYFEKEKAISGLSAYLKLEENMPMPFSGWMKFPGFEIASASPERFLKHQNGKLISQPIKGTIKRGKNEEEDAQLKFQLLHSEKERAENLMIVDLVRNDLASVSKIGSTGVDELFGIYAYPSVFQMISTVSSHLEKEKSLLDSIAACFPMGSMTGAPKKEVMRRIEELETRKRGPFSGCLGYVDPDGNFDFNVLIRSLFVDYQQNKTFFGVGSAITIDAQAAHEWEECQVKASKILSIFGEDWKDLFS